jgi:hypothetical protein
MALPAAPSNLQTLIPANFIETTLASNVAAAATTIPCTDALDFPSPSGGNNEYICVFTNTRELFRVTAKSGNNLTVIREQEGTTADFTTPSGEVIQIVISTKYYTDIIAKQEQFQRFMIRALGYAATGYAIVDTGNPTTEMWHTTENDTPDMNVKVKAGLGITENEVAETISTEVIGPITAPSSNNRIDLLQWTLGTGLNIKTGTEAATPTTPMTPDANSIVIYEIGQPGNYLTPSTTQIVNAMLYDRRSEAY